MRLHSERSGTGPRAALLHGFGQTGRCWGAVADDLARDHELVIIDAPGHAGSSAVRADLGLTADLIGEAAGEATYIGYSMGARMALHVAVGHPDQVRGLVLIGGTAGIADAADREERRRVDRDRAARLREHGVEAFFASWFDQPLFATLPPSAQFLDERRRNTADGLASSLELAGTGSQEPLWDRLAGLNMPVLLLAGELDTRYCELARQMSSAIGPNATAREIPGAGHTAHLERPQATIAAIRDWEAHSTAT